MKYFELIVAHSHVGSGKSLEINRYFEAEDILTAYESAKNMPASKKRHDSIKQVVEISYANYLLGKIREMQNPYLNTYTKS